MFGKVWNFIFPPLKKFRLLLDFFERRFVRIFQNLLPRRAKPVGISFQPDQERHPMMKRRDARVRRRRQHREFFPVVKFLPQAREREKRFAGLDEAWTPFSKNPSARIRQRFDRYTEESAHLAAACCRDKDGMPIRNSFIGT